MTQMKRNIRNAAALILALILAFSLAACGRGTSKTAPAEGLWKDAMYLIDTELGTGAKTLKVEVKAEEKAVLFTVHTDKDTVGEALLDNGLVAGEEGPYGLYVKVVNGITADYDVDQSYWAFNIDGETAMTGVDGAKIAEGTLYQLAYTK